MPFGSIRRLCGTEAPSQPITSTGQNLLVTFQSDGSVQAKGFQITYRSVASSRARRSVGSNSTSSNSSSSSNSTASASTSGSTASPDTGNSSSSASAGFTWGASSSSPSSASSPTSFVNSYGDLTYDSSFWLNYDAWYSSWDPYAAFGNLSEYDWVKAYDSSTALDYSDFRFFALFLPEEIKWFGTQAEDFIAQCTFDGRECQSTAFERIINPQFGNCYIFNSIYNSSEQGGLFSEIRNTSKTGKEFGLKLTLFLDKENYIGVLSQSSGAQIVVNSPDTPPMPESDSFVVSAGTATMVSVREERISRKGGKYGDCLKSWPEFIAFDTDFTSLWPVYNQRTCEHYCIEAEKFSRCKCVTDYYS